MHGKQEHQLVRRAKLPCKTLSKGTILYGPTRLLAPLLQVAEKGPRLGFPCQSDLSGQSAVL
jgi:hypothetical protein